MLLRPIATVLLLLAAILPAPSPTKAGDDLPRIEGVELQPLAAQARRVADALETIGRPLSEAETARLAEAVRAEEASEGVRTIQEVLDPHVLAFVNVNPESRVKARAGPSAPALVQGGWTAFLVKVHNEAGVTAPLRVWSPNARPVYRQSANSPRPEPGLDRGDLRERWADVRSYDEPPLNPGLSGLPLEYRIVQILSRDAGSREGKLVFDVGQGTQDLGFRSEVDLLFTAAPAVPVTVHVLDEDGSPTTAAFVVRDEQGRVYPSQGRRLAPDFFFHPQVYRADGETIDLPPGRFEFVATRGPEYRETSRTLKVPEGADRAEASFHLERWADLAAMGWYSGDHHIHAAGCAHYESPTEGVAPADMMRHILGEDLKVGCVLSWGPCWYHQKQFFEGKINKLSTADYLMRYDVEVSGFPSSHAGHLCLLRLREDDYPGTTTIEEWPSWDLPILKWGKSQGGVVGFSHSGWGLQTESKDLPNYEVPPFNGIGADEYIVDVAHDVVDFISSVDTPAPHELNIWYHTLNCGFRTRISGETDFPCIYGERVGLGRAYVKLDDGPLDFDRWTEGLKLGRSYVSDGTSHVVDFRVDDVEVGESGSELRIERPGNVKVRLNVGALLPESQADIGRRIARTPLDEQPYWHLERARLGDSRKVPVEIVVNGDPVARLEVEADGEFRDLEFAVPIERSSWVAARIYPSSHTNPVFVLVGDEPIRASKRSASWCLEGVDVCWREKEPLIRDSERAEAADAYEVARAAYRRILSEAVEDRPGFDGPGDSPPP